MTFSNKILFQQFDVGEGNMGLWLTTAPEDADSGELGCDHRTIHDCAQNL